MLGSWDIPRSLRRHNVVECLPLCITRSILHSDGSWSGGGPNQEFSNGFPSVNMRQSTARKVNRISNKTLAKKNGDLHDCCICGTEHWEENIDGMYRTISQFASSPRSRYTAVPRILWPGRGSTRLARTRIFPETFSTSWVHLVYGRVVTK